MQRNFCPVCGSKAEVGLLGIGSIYQVTCKICGTYRASDIVLDDLPNKVFNPNRPKISAYLRERTIKELETITVFLQENDQIQTPLVTVSEIIKLYPKKISERIDRALLNIAALSKYAGYKVDLSLDDYPVLFAESKNTEAVMFMLGLLLEEKYLIGERVLAGKFTLSSKGWSRVFELERGNKTAKNQGFVAMWFDNSMDSVWENGISKAIADAGFEPFRINLKEHNNKICDEIIAEIRKSKFVVTDFTGQRGGVYFEAGFALGLGLPVIWTCKSGEEGLLHFDTRQYNHILWDNENDLYTKLLNRIRATVI